MAKVILEFDGELDANDLLGINDLLANDMEFNTRYISLSRVEPEVKPEIAEVIKMINEEWRTVDSYDKTTFRAMYNKDRELSDFAKLVLESLKEKIKQQFSV